MTPAAAMAALTRVRGEIVGLKTAARRNHGAKSNWPPAVNRKLEDLREQARGYQSMLTDAVKPQAQA